jgi:DNA-binding GntR family transcriptional regulator
MVVDDLPAGSAMSAASRTRNSETDDVAVHSGARLPPLIQRSVRALLSDILAGVYAPGERIHEATVAARLKTSRAPVREALRVLEQDGLIELTPWVGARVIDPSPQQMADSFDLLAAVFGSVARFAARNASNAELRTFAQRVTALEQCAARSNDGIQLLDTAYRASDTLAAICGSPLAEGMVRKLGRVAYLSYRYLNPAPARWRKQAVANHRRLELALRARSEERSDRAARKIILHARALLLKRALAEHEQER